MPVDPRNYRHPKRGDIIVSLAGIATNIVLAFIFALLVALIGLVPVIPSAAETQALLQAMFGWGVFLNLMLAMFNLLPVPPLDGSHVLKYLLPPGWAMSYQRVETQTPEHEGGLVSLLECRVAVCVFVRHDGEHQHREL